MESQNVEWKESWRDDFLRWICGFANAEGGVLLIGVNDNGKPCGLKNAPKLLEDLPNKVRDILGIAVAVNLRSSDGQPILEISVPPYPSPISYRGHYYQRIGSTNQELKGAALDRFLLRKQGRTWDGVPLPGVTLEDLDAGAVRETKAGSQTESRLDERLDEKLDERLGKTRSAIIRHMLESPKITVTELGERLSISRNGIDKNIQILKRNGYIRRVGPAKGGRWEVNLDPPESR